jgi:hypothetical protein
MKNKPWSKQELDLLQKTAENLKDDAAIIYEVSKATERSASAIANKLWQMRKNEQQVPQDSRVPVFYISINGTRLELHLQKSSLKEMSTLRIYDKANDLVGTLQVTVQ